MCRRSVRGSGRRGRAGPLGEAGSLGVDLWEQNNAECAPCERYRRSVECDSDSGRVVLRNALSVERRQQVCAAETAAVFLTMCPLPIWLGLEGGGLATGAF